MKRRIVKVSGSIVVYSVVALIAFLCGAVIIGVLQSINFAVIGTKNESSDTQVINAIERQERVVLLSLGVQGIADNTITNQFLGYDVPGTSKVLFLKYNYRAMLGIDGKKVKVTKAGEHEFKIEIPEFEFLGNSDIAFQKAVEQNGIISWATPDIDVSKMVNEVLNSSARQKYLLENQDLLKEQCQSYYNGLVKTIDGEAKITFDFHSRS